MDGADLKELLTHTKITSVIRSKPLVALGHQVNVGTVLDTLSSNGILSAPIFVSDADGKPQESIDALIGFVGCWDVLSAFLQALGPTNGNGALVSKEQLEAQGEALCGRPVLSLFEGNAALQAAIDAGDIRGACADWDLHSDPNSSLLDVIRSCFLPRPQSSGLISWGSGAVPGFSTAATATTPRASGGNSGVSSGAVSPSPPGAGAAAAAATAAGHSRHPAASHRVVVCLPPEAGSSSSRLAVVSQSDILRFLAGHHDSLRPLGKASLAELGLATGSLHLAAGPPNPGTPINTLRPPPVSTVAGSGGSAAVGSSGERLPHIPSSPKPPLAGGGYPQGGGGLLGTLSGSGFGTSPVGDCALTNMLQKSGSGPVAMQMSPPASPRVSCSPRVSGGQHLLAMGSLGGGGHRAPARRQLVAVHESVTALEAFRVLLQQRVSAAAVLAGAGPSANMRLVGNLSASDLRHLKPGGFGCLALTVKQFLASKPLAPDQAIPLTPSRPIANGAPASPGGPPPRPPVLMAHAPGVFTCQATASLEELVKMLGAPQRGIHRVYVVDPDQRPAGVVTGTDVLQLLTAASSRD